jgi:hypothetical protein
MIPNRQNPAYALFARHPIVPQPPDVLAADLPASQKPLPPSGTEDTPVTECPLPARLRIKIRRQYQHCTRGCGPQILSAFVKQRTYQPFAHR